MISYELLHPVIAPCQVWPPAVEVCERITGSERPLFYFQLHFTIPWLFQALNGVIEAPKTPQNQLRRNMTCSPFISCNPDPNSEIARPPNRRH